MTEDEKRPARHNRAGLELAHEIAATYQTAATKSGVSKGGINRSPVNRFADNKPGADKTGTAAGRGAGTDRYAGNDWANQGADTTSEPAAVADHVRGLIRQQGWEGELSVQRVFHEWDDIVGSEVAAHCRIVGHADGQVQVQADSTAWATQLRLLAPHIVAKLNERLGDGTVTRVEIRGPEAPSWKSGNRSIKDGRGPRDTYG